MGNFLKLLVQKKRAALLPEIAEAFKTMVDEAKEHQPRQGNLGNRPRLGDAEKNSKSTRKLTGKKVELTTSVDPSIIGGIVAQVGDLVLDGSIKTQLAGLKDSIKGRE
jgi:F-type H+-transporting ATPase subunit delta